MRIPRIYTAAALKEGASIRLDKTASNYLARVLRLTPGAEIILFDGQGGHFNAVIENMHKNALDIAIGQHSAHEIESPLEITLAQGISRGERMDYTIQKSVELGVSRIIPLITGRCGVKLDAERAGKRHHHWQGIIASACEQCGRNRLPSLLPTSTLTDWLARTTLNQEHPCLKLVLDPRNSKTLSQCPKPPARILLLIGPEGGLTNDEIEQVRQAGFSGIQLGPRILRTETAGIAAISALQTLWGDLA